ncbi:hypothetical protein E4U13_008149 [Claviceps humidiphila]|uniref:Uncharacterized protein n=1 Tax=Claviceps humidiphila TaxID=1294629 RepID=A0A9P7Q3P5_9HYPO|nr:hypothetical protein E4U13_008149 [Claviceps humidiphila]
MFSVSARRLTQAGKDSIVASVASKPALTVFDNPYTARKAWPPAVDHLNPAQQLRFEKKYKRRVYLACHSPKWNKATKIGQLVSITGVLVYAFFFSGEIPWWGQMGTRPEDPRQKPRTMYGILENGEPQDVPAFLKAEADLDIKTN